MFLLGVLGTMWARIITLFQRSGHAPTNAQQRTHTMDCHTVPVHVTHVPVHVFRDLTPHPQYAAFYKWLQQDYKADAVVHFGMHGTVEWLPGAPLGEPTWTCHTAGC